MALDQLAVHIVPDANPVNVNEMLQALKNEEHVFSLAKDLVEHLAEKGISSNSWVQLAAVGMGLLLDKEHGGLKLSDQGRAFVALREDVRSDILHFLMATGWDPARPTEFLPSWAYRACCDQYWSTATLTLTDAYLNRQVQDMVNATRAEFERMGVGPFKEISFSRKSLTGALKWLDALQPPVLSRSEERSPYVFSRRSFCPPELLMLSLGHVWGNEVDVLDSELLLSREKREQICRLCLLDPDALDQTLDWALSIFPHLAEDGTSAGVYGRFIRLHKLPTLVDVVR